MQGARVRSCMHATTKSNKLPTECSHLKFSYLLTLVWLGSSTTMFSYIYPHLSSRENQVKSQESLEQDRRNANSLSLWWRLRHIFVNFLPSHPHSHSATTLQLHIHQSKINFSLVAPSQGLHREGDKQGSRLLPLGYLFSLPETQSERGRWGFPGGAVVENPPANAGDTGPSPGPGRSHMPRSN